MELTTGNRHLGAVLGSTQSKVEFVTKKVEEWVEDVKQLAKIVNRHFRAPSCLHWVLQWNSTPLDIFSKNHPRNIGADETIGK